MLFTEDFWEWTEYTKTTYIYIIKSVNYSPVNNEVIRDVQNPIYGDNADSNALWVILNTMHAWITSSNGIVTL